MVIFRGKQRIFCAPEKEGLLFIKDEVSRFYPWEKGDGDEAGRLLSRAVREGLRGEMTLLLTLPETRYTEKRLPDMSASDLAETMRWEEDRLFPGKGPYLSGWSVISHTPEGYRLFAAGCPEEILRPWAEAAEKKGISLRAVPPTEAGPVLLVGRDGCTVVEPDGSRLHFSFDEGEDFQSFSEGTDCMPVPLADCGEEEWRAAREHFFPSGPGSREEALVSLSARIREKPGISIVLARKTAFHKETVIFRAAQGACAVLFAACIVLGANAYMMRKDFIAEEARAVSLESARRAMDAERKARAEKEAEKKERKAFIDADPLWEGRLLSLAEALPPGTALKEIETDGGKTRVTGTAAERNRVGELRSRLEAAWQMDCRTESVRKATGLPYYEFTIFCEKRKENL